jgi:hypothetical protein
LFDRDVQELPPGEWTEYAHLAADLHVHISDVLLDLPFVRVAL